MTHRSTQLKCHSILRSQTASIKKKALDSNETAVTATPLKTVSCSVSYFVSLIECMTVVTDADSDEKVENLPMILAQVEKNNFKPYKQGDAPQPTD